MIEKIVNFMQTRPKRALLLAVGFWLAIGLGGTLLHYYRTGTVTIVTSDTTSIVELTQVSNPTVVKRSLASLNARLAPGEYSLLVSSKIASTRQIIYVKARAHTQYSVALVRPLETEPVLSYGAYSVATGETVVRYVDMRDSQLYEVGPSGIPVSLATGVQFRSIKWLGADFGVGQSADGSRLYAIKTGVVSQINLPFTATNQINYDISTDKSLLISNGAAVYVTAADGGYAKIYSAAANTVIQAVSGGADRLLIGLDTKNAKKGDENAYYILSDLRGRELARLNHTSIYSFRWSPDGKKVVVTDPSGTTIYNNSLSPVSHLADKNALGIAWLDNKTLLYGLGDALYRYDSSVSVSSQVVSVGGGSTVSGIYPSSDASAVYISRGVAGATQTQGYSLVRVRLIGSAQTNVYHIDSLFPLRLAQCTAELVNFNRPLIYLTPYNPQGVDSCRQTVVTDLTKVGVDSSSYQVYTAPIDVGAD